MGDACQDWALRPGQLDCCIDGIDVSSCAGGHSLRLHSQDGSLSLEGRTGTPLFCQLDDAVQEGGNGRIFPIRFYDGMLRLQGSYRLQHYQRSRVPEQGQALRFEAGFAPAVDVEVLKRPCSGHPDFGLWANPALGLLEYWWRDRLVTAVEEQGNSVLAPWRRQVVAYLEETASASHAAVTFLAQLSRCRP